MQRITAVQPRNRSLTNAQTALVEEIRLQTMALTASPRYLARSLKRNGPAHLRRILRTHSEGLAAMARLCWASMVTAGGVLCRC
jgi:hypothetical protein